jgi:hypothetical protein
MAWHILRLQMEERPTIWRVAVNILNKQPTRDGPPAWGLGKVPTTPQGKNVSCYEIFTQKASQRALANVVMNLQVA